MLFPITFLAAIVTITPIITLVHGHPVPFIQEQTSVDTLVSRDPHGEDISFISTSKRRGVGVVSSPESALFERDTDMGAVTDNLERRSTQDSKSAVERRGFFKKIKNKIKKIGQKLGKFAGKVVKVAGKLGGIAGKIGAIAGKVSGIAGKVATTLGPFVLKREDLSSRDFSLSPDPSLSSLASRSVEWDQETAVFQRDMDMQPDGWLEERSMDSEFELAERDFDFDSEEDFE